MNFGNLVTLFAVGVLIFAALMFLPRYFSSEATAERRRRRSNRRIATKNRQPTVKFSVRTKRDDKKD